MTAGQISFHSRPTPFAHAFRPFFLLAGFWSVAALLLWMGAVRHGANVPTVLAPMIWHAHTMILGFGGAVIAGFVLTAAPIWTGQPRPQGGPLAALAALWLAGRLAVLVSAETNAWMAAAIDLAFPIAVTGWVALLIVRGGSWRNLPVVLAIGVLVGSSALVHAQALGLALTANVGNRLGIAAIAFLAALIGGRVTPFFTRNWLNRTGRGGPMPHEPADLDRLANTLAAAALVGWVALPSHALTAVLAGCASLATLARLACWKGWRTVWEPLVVILHLGYLWLPIGLAAIAVHAAGAVPYTMAIHALTAGLMGTLMMAMMTRVARGHTGRPLHADTATTSVYALIAFAGIARVLAAALAPAAAGLLGLSAGAWILAFLGYAARHTPMLLMPRADEA